MGRHFTARREQVATTVSMLILTLSVLMTTATLSTGAHAQGPGLTTISDTVYGGDGTPASGLALISWPSFQTADGYAVAAGSQSVTIGEGGAFNAQLVPNAGASPAGTLYVVVFQLDDGTVRTEYWSVPTNSPTTISAVRTTPGTGLGNLAATQQYVNAAVANRALDSSVVHLSGAETITGAKQFTVPPLLPSPAESADAANKEYVDQAVANVGSGNYVLLSGDTMTGPLTLPGPPTAPNQATDRQYVDNGMSAKADLVAGLIPTSELGTGNANASTCLTGNSTWGACGTGGAPAGITYATTAANWSQTIASPLTGGTQATVTLTPCPMGIDTTSGAGYQALISGGGNSEAVNVIATAGGCLAGAPSGTVVFTPFYSYAAGYSIGSASSGIQETLNAACGTDTTSWKNAQCNVTLPSNGPGYPNHSLNTYNVAGTIYLHSNQSIFSGYGTSLNCNERGPCLQIGDLVNSNDYTSSTVEGISFRTPTNLSSNPAFAGVAITQTQRLSQVVTITTATAHGLRPGDMATIMFTDNNAFWGDAIVTAVPNPTTFQYAHSGTDIAAQTTPGVVALTYVAVLDNAVNTHLADISYDKVGENGAFNNFFDLWDDENASIDQFNNNAIPLNTSANWSGSFVFSAGNQGAGHQIAPVITLRDSSITANYANGVTVYNSNGLYVENTVLQATGPWQVYSSNSTGNYQGAYLKNIYSESGPQMNPLSPAHSPFPGTGVAGLIAGPSSGAASFAIAGSGGTQGAFSTGGGGATAYSYFVVAKDLTTGTQTSPMQILNYNSTGSDSIPVRWPRVANGTDAITYDLIRIATPNGVNATYPYAGGCAGGSTLACGSIAINVAQCSGLVCTYTDSGSAVTVSYSIQQGNYAGSVAFWPGSIVSVNKSVAVGNEESNVVGIGLDGNPLQVASECTSWGATSTGGFTDCQVSLTASNNAVPNQTATLMTDGAASGGGEALSKGRLNFSTSPSANLQPHHIITLVDSQPALTRSTWGYRPAASATDTWIGTDVASGGVGLNQGQLAFGAPVSITNYIAATGDGVHANWLERLSAGLKEFNVPIKMDESVTISGLADGCLNIASGVISSTGSPCGSGGGGGAVSSVFGRSGAVIATAGDYIVSQVTGAAADAAVVHNTGIESISGNKTFTNTIVASGNLILPAGSGYAPAAGGLGLDTAAGLPVVNIGGTVQQVALTSSNISGQAGTALALAHTPTQCSGAFATGIAANGNANCTTPNVIQLAETAQPAGIPNWGVFWFDAATHTPRVIDNNGQPMQLGLANLFNSDPNGDPGDTLEERNGLNAQNFRVYSSYTNSSTWDRTSLGSESVSGTNYNVLRSEDAASGNAPSIGIHIGSSLKWLFGNDGTFKPYVGSTYDIGTDTGQAVHSVFATTSFNMYTNGRQDFEFANDGVNGTVANDLAVYNGSGAGVQTASTGSTDGVVGIVSSGAGTSGKSVITWAGVAACNFDAGNPVAGDYAVASTSQAGKCHDTGSANRPSGVQVIGRIEASGGVRVSLGAPSGSAVVSSVFGRIGAVTAQSGDYSVNQVTGAAPLASPAFTGTPTAPTPATSDSSTKIATTAWVNAQGYGSGGGGGAVSSVFGRTGTVAAQSGDYSVSQVSGAAPLLSPTFTGVLTHPDGTSISGAGWAGNPTFLNNVMINGNLNVAGTINQTSSSPTQWSGKEWTGTTVTVPSGMDFSMGVGADATFHCQLASGASCMPTGGGGAVASVFGRTGTVTAQSGDYTVAQVTGAAPLNSPTFTGSPAVPGYVPTSTSVNGHALSGNVTVSASDITTGTLPHAQLPALVSGDIPNNAANTSGTAANLGGTPALPNGTTASTQGAGDNSTKLATTAYVDRALGATWVPVTYSSSGSFTFPASASKAAVFALTLPYSVTATKIVYRVGTADNSANTYAVAIYNASGALVVHYGAAGTAFAPTANTVMSQAWSEGATALAPGKYFILWTSSCTASCATVNAENAAFVTSYSNTSFSVGAGGTAPGSITTGTGLESFAATVPAIVVE